MRLAEIDSMATHITSVFSLTKSFSGDTISKPEQYVIRSEKLKEDLMDDYESLLQQEREAHEMISVLQDPIERAILIDYHLNGIKIKRLENIYHYTERQIYNIRHKAYQNISDNFRFFSEII